MTLFICSMFMSVYTLYVSEWVAQAGLGKTLQTQAAGIALAAGKTFRGRIVAGMRQAVINSQFHSAPDDVGLGHADQRCVYFEFRCPFDSGLGRQIGHRFVRLDVFRPAVRIAGVIKGVDADIDICRTQYLRPAEGKGEEDGVAGRHIGDRDFAPDTLFRYIDVGCQRTAAHEAQIKIDDQMFRGADFLCILPGDRQFEAVSLAVGKADGIRDKAVSPGYRHTGGGIQPAAIQNYRFTLHDKGLRNLVMYFMDCNFTRNRYNKSTFSWISAGKK